jgi:UDP-N-acetylglucosamine 4,6-dehydratase/5-epimerase
MSNLYLDGKRVLITGGTGSFGQCFVQKVLDDFDLGSLVILSRDELKQYEMQNKLLSHPKFKCMRFFIGDVRDRHRMEMAMREVDYVIHAAALKQIAAAEYNPFECIHTNVIGAENIVNAALRAGVKKVIALSTDKAVSPVNLYGASKLASDKIFVAANHLSGSVGTRFSVVRYGNVVGSRGSVIPYFKSLINNGAKSLPITDERMTRFWITLQQGADFVLSSMATMHGGEIFIPKIPSMKITDLATAMSPDLPHKIIGIRPGEKLHEVLITEDDARTTLELDDRYIIEPEFAWWSREPYVNEGAKSATEGFIYSSNTNKDWLDAEKLRALIVEPD